MIDACIVAGVSRFLPSEFGSNLSNPKSKALPVFGRKVVVNDYAEEKARTNPGFSYTLVRTGAFLDWGLEHKFLIDWESGTPRIFDSGDQLFSTTTLESVGLAVVGVLSHPEETKNKAVSVQDMTMSQNRLLAIIKKLTPNKKQEPVYSNTDEMFKTAHEKLAKGDYSVEVMFEFILCSLFGDGYNGLMSKTDNELLGIPGDKTDEDAEAILKSLLAAAN